MSAVVKYLEAINEGVGRVVSWLAVVMVLTTFAVAVLRYGVGIGFVWMQESYVWMHAIIFMVASGYTLLHDGHVRVDVIYGGMSPRGQAWVNLLGAIFLLVPMIGMILWTATPYVLLSWSRFETSPDVGGLKGLFLLKTAILAFGILLALQGLALALRSWLVLSGHPDAQPDTDPEEPGI